MVAKAQAAAATAGAAAGAKAGADYAAANGPKAVQAMAVAATELITLIKNQVVGKGANYVVVNNSGDFASAPVGKAQAASTQALIVAMIAAFNDTLKAGLSSEPKVLLIDFYFISHDQIVNPGPYGLSNTSSPACTTNALDGTALVCTGKTLSTGDVSHYMFADDRHPTPYEGRLFAQYVAEQMVLKGWL
jgi:outer membrane lipase/esterase